MVRSIRKKKGPVTPVKVGAKLRVDFIKEGEKFVAYSPFLDLSTYGETFEQAQKSFEEAVLIFFEECIKDGTLHDVLTSLGWKSVNKEWVPPSYIGQVNLPIPDIPALAN